MAGFHDVISKLDGKRQILTDGNLDIPFRSFIVCALLLGPSQRYQLKCMQGVCRVSAGSIPVLVDEVSAINHLYSRVYAKCMQGVCWGHPRGFN